MCVANVILGQERVTEQFLSMRFFYDSVILQTVLVSKHSLYKTVLVSKQALRFQRTLYVRAFSLCT